MSESGSVGKTKRKTMSVSTIAVVFSSVDEGWDCSCKLHVYMIESQKTFFELAVMHFGLAAAGIEPR